MSTQDDYYDAVLRAKYAKGSEHEVDDVRRRVARALAAVELPIERAQREAEFLELLRAGFCPGGRIMSGAGSDGDTTLISCFVQPLAGPGLDAAAGPFAALCEAAETLSRGGGVGYDLSCIAPSGSRPGAAGGPVASLQLFDAACATLAATGARRGAQMGVLRIDHPDIEAFIAAKDLRLPLHRLQGLCLEPAELKAFVQLLRRLTTFNLSVAVTDAFMRLKAEGGELELVHEAEPDPARYPAAEGRSDGRWVYARTDARTLWMRLLDTSYATAEPGVLFIDRINAEDNLRYCETIAATNPCGEQPLPAHGSCCLGSFNLAAFVREPFGAAAAFDWPGFRRLVAPAVRLLDNVLDATHWPLPAQHDEARATRRVGLGFTGLGSALMMLRLAYGSEAAERFAAELARTLCHEAYRASVALAVERGAFPRYDREAYLGAPFVQRLPEDLRQAIRRHGIRNSHLLCIAPAGSISLAFGRNVTSGIEPAFAWDYLRRTRDADGRWQAHRVQEYAYRQWLARGGDRDALPPWFVSSRQLSPAAQLRMQAAVQPYIDASISKTVQLPADTSFEDFREVYDLAWTLGCKGCTTYRPNPMTGAVLCASAACEHAAERPPAAPAGTR